MLPAKVEGFKLIRLMFFIWVPIIVNKGWNAMDGPTWDSWYTNVSGEGAQDAKNNGPI